MKNEQIGDIIRKLRLEKDMTQKQLAEMLHISDKTVSKWERNGGLPDISLIPQLADLLGVEIKNLLAGNIEPNDYVGGNLKDMSYFVCPTCHNVTMCTGKAEVICCGKKLNAQIMKKASQNDRLEVEIIDDDWYISSGHPMNKGHYISFVGLVTNDRLQIVKQYPEWNLGVRFPKREHGMLIWYCIQDGLFYQLL
ncbi:helix-turn-helix domain-containing protein [Thomasclavelia sp.]